MFCLGCSYNLRGLPEPRCPECGRPFDPGDSRTFRDSVVVPRPFAPVLIAYLLPLGAGALFWLTIPLPFPCPLWVRIRAVGILTCGPVTFLAQGAAPFIGPLIWLGLLGLLYRNPRRIMPLWLHVGLAVLWVIAGCIPLGISV